MSSSSSPNVFAPRTNAAWLCVRRYRQVVVVQQAPQGVAPAAPHELLVLVTCPTGVRSGDAIEIEVEPRNRGGLMAFLKERCF